MNKLFTRLCRHAAAAPLLLGALLAPAACKAAPLPEVALQPAVPAAAAAAAAAAVLPEASACGWFDSSLDLRQGLAVSEMAEPDWTVLVLWFGPVALRQRCVQASPSVSMAAAT